MRLVLKILHLLISFLFTRVHAHSVELRKCLTTSGKLRIFVEHWHEYEVTSVTQAKTMTIKTDSTGEVQKLVPIGFVTNHPDRENLPGCVGESELAGIAATCKGTKYNDWVYYDFPTVCDEPVSYTFLQGDTYILEDGCTSLPLYPKTITETFTDNSPPIISINGEECTDGHIIIQATTTTVAEGTLVQFDISAVDDCDANPKIESSQESCSFFPLGVTNVTITAIDVVGFEAECTLIVIVSGMPMRHLQASSNNGCEQQPSATPSESLSPTSCPASLRRNCHVFPDPHFVTWNNDETFEFHGSCDMVLTKNNFMEVQIRTRPRKRWGQNYKGYSIVTQVAVIVENQVVLHVIVDDDAVNGYRKIDSSGSTTEVNIISINSRRLKITFPLKDSESYVELMYIPRYGFDIQLYGTCNVFGGSKGLCGHFDEFGVFYQDGRLFNTANSYWLGKAYTQENYDYASSWKITPLNNNHLENPSMICHDVVDCTTQPSTSDLTCTSVRRLQRRLGTCNRTCEDITGDPTGLYKEFCKGDFAVIGNHDLSCQPAYVDPPEIMYNKPECVDSENYEYVRPRNPKKRKSCREIFRKIVYKGKPFCDKPGVKENCPVACGYGDCCKDKPDKFSLGGKPPTDCTTIASSKNKLRLCKKNKVQKYCLKTCEMCNV